MSSGGGSVYPGRQRRQAAVGRRQNPMIIRPMRAGEGKLAAEVSAASETAARWSAADYESLPNQGGTRFCLLAEEPPGQVAGLVAACALAPEGEILDLAVIPEKQQAGLGGALLAAAIERLAAAGVRNIWLEVRQSSQAAIAFYLHHGFQVEGRRPGYYQSPPEDALILGLRLEASALQTSTGLKNPACLS